MSNDDFNLGILFVTSSVFCFDLFDLLLRAYLREAGTPAGIKSLATSLPLDVPDFTPYQIGLHLRPYALIASVHNLGEELDDFLQSLGEHRKKLWVIDDASTDDTWERLQGSGVQCQRLDQNQRKPGALKHLLKWLPADIQTVIVLDPDARILDQGHHQCSSLERVVFEFQQSGFAAVVPRIEVRRHNWLTCLQAFEYWLSFSLGRRVLGKHSITPGIAVYRRDALARVLEQHTRSIYAEDLENSFILLELNETVYYDGRLQVVTEGKDCWSEWFSQRVGWSYGFFRVYVQHFGQLWKLARKRYLLIYHYLVYMGFFSLLLHPLKLVGVFLLLVSATNGIDNLFSLNLLTDSSWTSPFYFSATALQCTLLSLVALRLGVEADQRKPLLPAALTYLPYVLLRLVPTTIGYLNWFSLRWGGRRVYRDHYQEVVNSNGVLNETK